MKLQLLNLHEYRGWSVKDSNSNHCLGIGLKEWFHWNYNKEHRKRRELAEYYEDFEGIIFVIKK